MKDAASFCSCIKKVKKTVKLRSGSSTDKNKEKAGLLGFNYKKRVHTLLKKVKYELKI